MSQNSTTDRNSLRQKIKRGAPKKYGEVAISPVRVYTKEEIKSIRENLKMTQKTFAQVLGVALRTVEAWEMGIRNPTGTANRMLELITLDNNLFERCGIVDKQIERDDI